MEAEYVLAGQSHPAAGMCFRKEHEAFADLLKAAMAMILAGNDDGARFNAVNLLHAAIAKAKGLDAIADAADDGYFE